MKYLFLILSIGYGLTFWSFALAENSFRIAYFSKDIAGLDTLGEAFDPDSYSVVNQIFDALIHIDLDGNLIPGLAVSWKKISDTKWAFSLRQGVKFHNGEDFDAEAVKFTFDYIMNPLNRTRNRVLIARIIKEVEILSPFEIIISLHHPDGMFLNRLCLMSICPPRYIKEDGIIAFHSHPVGTGPFQFESWKKGKSINLKANRQYWEKGKPYLERVTFLILPERQWAKAIAHNDVDFVPNLSGRQTRALMADKKANVRILKRLTLLSYMTFIKNKGQLADVNVRRALNYALNKEDLVRFADFGNAIPQASFGRKGQFGSAPDLNPYPYDPEKARALLAKAGYKNGFSLRMAATDTARSVAQIIRTNLRAIGISLKIDFIPRDEIILGIVKHKMAHGKAINYDLVLLLVDDPVNHFGFMASVLLDSKMPSSLLNHPEFDMRFEKAMNQSDPKEHERLLQDLDRYIYDQALTLFTTQRIITAAVRKEFIVEKFGMTGHLDYQLLTEVQHQH
jgi:peptide/nickel transport system substrate-binding protein